MKQIIIKTGSKSDSVLKEMAEKKKERREAFLKSLPPKEIQEWINSNVEKTYEINGGNLDKESFRLGLHAMWFHLYNKKLLMF